MPQMRTRFRIEVGLSVLSLFLFMLTLVWREWIEGIFRVDPDSGSGSLEWAIAGALLVTAMLFGLLARVNWRRLKSAHAAG